MSDTNDAWRMHGDMPDLDMMLGLSEMTQQELRDRLERLQTIVPMRQYGDGLETYEDYLAPQHAETEAMFNAARELSLIRGVLGKTHSMPAGEHALSLAHAAQTAINTLAELGITYVGFDATYVFWSPKRGRYIQQDTEQRQKLMQRAERDIGYRFLTGRYENSFERNADLPNHQSPAVTSQQRSEADAWQLAYPWRSSNRLNTLFRLGRLEPNSRIWHAARILSRGARIEDSFAYVAKVSVDEPLRNEDVIEHMREVAETSLLIGKSAEALVKKPLEYDKIERTEATERRAKAGGRKSASQGPCVSKPLCARLKTLRRIFHHLPRPAWLIKRLKRLSRVIRIFGVRARGKRTRTCRRIFVRSNRISPATTQYSPKPLKRFDRIAWPRKRHKHTVHNQNKLQIIEHRM